MPYTFRTDLFMTVVGAADRELEVEFRYTVTPGSDDYWDGQQWQPGWAAEVDLQSARIKVSPTDWVAMPEWMFGLFFADRDFHDQLLADAAEQDEGARDRRADERREELMMERGR
jgi:hypothetical protein